MDPRAHLRLITIGMGVHWLGDDVLDSLRHHLRPGGLLAILATGFSGPGLNRWQEDYQQVRLALTKSRTSDWTGETQLAPLGYERIDLIEQTYRGKIGVTDLVNHLLSFSSEAEMVTKNYGAVTESLAKVLQPHLVGGRLECFWTSSARLFADQKSTAMPLSTQSP